MRFTKTLTAAIKELRFPRSNLVCVNLERLGTFCIRVVTLQSGNRPVSFESCCVCTALPTSTLTVVLTTRVTTDGQGQVADLKDGRQSGTSYAFADVCLLSLVVGMEHLPGVRYLER